MSEPDMVKLDAIELSYDRVEATARLYTGDEISCMVYMYNKEKSGNFVGTENNLPTERYIQIMCEGASHFGVNEDYIKGLRNVDQRPRKDIAKLISLN